MCRILDSLPLTLIGADLRNCLCGHVSSQNMNKKYGINSPKLSAVRLSTYSFLRSRMRAYVSVGRPKEPKTVSWRLRVWRISDNSEVWVSNLSETDTIFFQWIANKDLLSLRPR
jgi:hypothetical protein